MNDMRENDWLFRRQYEAVQREHPEWPEDKKVWVARRRVFWTKKLLGLDAGLAA